MTATEWEAFCRRRERSPFRMKFHLSRKDIAYIEEKGMDTISRHAYDFIGKRRFFYALAVLLCLVGLGNIGRAVMRVSRAFGMKVYVCTSVDIDHIPAGAVKADLPTLFRECDIVTLHCPLRPDNAGMVNSSLLRLMKPTAILINTARGPLVNEADLAAALNDGVLRAAGVDVLSTEPPTADNPLLTARNCFITPHLAWASVDARERLMGLAVNNLEQYLKGNPVNVVK